MSTADEVLLDAIMTRHGYTRAEAEEAARYVEHAKHVRIAMMEPAWARVSYGEFEGMACAHCEGQFALHRTACPLFLAWVALGDARADSAMGAAWDEGVSQSPFRAQIRGHMHIHDVPLPPEFFHGTQWALDDQEAADTDAPVPPPGHETSHPPR